MKATKLKAPKRIKVRGETFWRVEAPAPGGGRIRKTFKDRPDAVIFFERSKIQIQQFGEAAMINEKLRADAVRAAELLAPLGVTLLDAARAYVANHAARSGGVTLSKAVKDLLTTRETEGASGSYRATMKSRLTRFVGAFPPDRTTREIVTADVDAFLSGLANSPGTANTYRRDIRTLFSFCVGRGYAGENPADRASRFRTRSKGIEILTPAQTAGLIAACDDAILPAVAIAVFCGLRAAEVARLDWSAVDLEEKILTVDASIAKTASRRTVAIPDNCVAWLLPLKQDDGPVTPPDFRKLFDRARVRAGFKPSFDGRPDDVLQDLLAQKKKALTPWPANCLRHGAISYGLAVSRDIGKTATSAGNSPAVIARHYLELVKPSAATAFFAIRPESPANMTTFKAA